METTATALIPAEAARLTVLEEALTRDMQTFKSVGAALSEIRDARLYRQTHGTFEDYCRERWGMQRAHAYRLIESAEVVRHLSPIGDTPSTESQARPLTRLAPEHQPIAWQAAQASAAAEDRPVTAKDVTRAVNTIKRAENPKPKEEPQEDPQSPEEPPKPGTAMYHAMAAINALRKIKNNDQGRLNALRMVGRWVKDNE
jgi:hypothetical protein